MKFGFVSKKETLLCSLFGISLYPTLIGITSKGNRRTLTGKLTYENMVPFLTSVLTDNLPGAEGRSGDKGEDL